MNSLRPISLSLRSLDASCFALLGLVLALRAPDPLLAQTRFYRFFDAEDGLNPTSVRSLVQDRDGFLWIGTVGGLFRYDGHDLVAWAPSSLDQTIVALSASAAGTVIALEEGEGLFAITPEGAETIRGPDGHPLVDARDATFGPAGRLWVVRGDGLWVRDRRGRWTAIRLPLAAGETPRLVRPDPRGGVNLATNRGAWRISLPAAPRRFLDLSDIVDLHSAPGGRVLVLDFYGRVYEVVESGSRHLFWATVIGAGGRGISIVEREGTIWVAMDRYLVGWLPDRPAEILGLEAGIQSGGPLLVDHEKSLWMGSFVGLYQFPEPETRLWTELNGLPSNHTRYLAQTGDTVWVTTWQGTGYIRRESGRWTAGTDLFWGSWTRLFPDSAGSLWIAGENGLFELRGGRKNHHPIEGPLGLYGFHQTPDGATWLATSRGLLYRDTLGGRARAIRVSQLGADPPMIETVRLDHRDDLWVSSGETVCRAPAEDVLGGGSSVRWSCEEIPGAVHLTGLLEMPSGELWASTNRLGVLRRRGQEWEVVPGILRLPSRSILSLVPARSGSVWLVGHGALHRVSEDPASADGWRVHERLARWHGLPVVMGTHVMEDAEGGVWVASSRGVAHVPASVRSAPIDPPRVALVDAQVDEERVFQAASLELPHEKNRMELRFAALSYRDPSLIRYQVRLSPEDPWQNTAGEPSFRWVDLPRGDYHAEVRASLDGESWSPVPARFAFSVAPPWHRQPWALALLVALAGLALYAAHRIRVVHLLDLERQRTRIAMDLHDDIGSGLGSIGILSGILANDGVEEHERDRMAREIAGTAGELGMAVSHIVWALDPRARTMGELAARLAEHGRRLFADDSSDFRTAFPDRWPAEPLSQDVRRNVLLVGLEALHNAARHAAARHVELRLLPRRAGGWELSVIDDGVGLGNGAARAAAAEGHGLTSMRRRAAEIGAELRWTSSAGGGTGMILAFQPFHAKWRPEALWRDRSRT